MAKQRTGLDDSLSADHSIKGRTANQISESIKVAINRGAFRSGDALPAIRALAERLGVNRNTVASAYRHLSDAGIIEGRGRQGSRVATQAGSASRRPTMLHDIGGGNPDSRLLPDVKTVLSQSVWLPRGYEDPPDNPALIDFARQQLADDGMPLGDVWISNGTFDAVDMILRAYLQPGDAIAVEDPCFMTTLGLVKELGLLPVPMAVDDQGVLPEAMDKALKKGVKAVILTPRAHNPFGGSWTAKRRDDLARVIGRHKDLLLIEDDHFAPLSPFKPVTLVSADRPNWAIIRSVSKYVGPDLRLAFVNSSDGLAKKVSGLAAFSHRWVSGVLQAAVLSTVTSKDYARIIRDASQAYTARRKYLLDALRDAGIEAHGEDGINVWIPVSDEQAITRRLMESGWIVRPGDIFRLESGQAIRVTVSTLTDQEAHELAVLLAGLQRQGAVQRGA